MQILDFSALSPYFTYTLRLLIAGICGGVVGYEREKRQKSAGLRTHILISIASALMMLVSKYGFYDVIGEYTNIDPSRVAASVVTAIGFLGSGVILTHNRTTSGITTSAGIWGTVGVGLAVGSGMIFLGIIAAFMILMVEMFSRRILHFSIENSNIERLTVEIQGSYKELLSLKSRIEALGFKIRRVEFTQKSGEQLKSSIYIEPRKNREITEILEIQENWITSMEVKGHMA